MDAEMGAAIAVTTASLLLAIASIYVAVSCSLQDVVSGQAASVASKARYFAPDDDEDADMDFLAAKMEMVDAAVVVAASFGEDALTDVQLFGSNIGQWYVKPRSLTWFETFVEEVYDDERWKRLFRVGRGTFMYLEASLRAQLVRCPTDSLARALPTRLMSVAKQLAVTLFKSGHGGSNFSVGELFGIGESTVSEVVWRVVQAIVQVEGPRRIRWPADGEEREAAIAQMEAMHGIPNCIGAIDCTHVMHEAPPGFLTTCYYDRDHNFSTVVQLVADQEHRILNVNVGYPGAVHDARVLVNSELYKDTQTYLGGPSVNVRGVPVPQMLVADAGYPNVPWLLTPFPGHHLNDVQKSFNYKQSSTRICIEQTNADLKGVQRYLLQRVQQPNPTRLPIYIAACAVLHNLRIDRGDVMERGLRFTPDTVAAVGAGPNAVPVPQAVIDQAIQIRGAIAEMLYEDE